MQLEGQKLQQLEGPDKTGRGFRDPLRICKHKACKSFKVYLHHGVQRTHFASFLVTICRCTVGLTLCLAMFASVIRAATFEMCVHPKTDGDMTAEQKASCKRLHLLHLGLPSAKVRIRILVVPY